MNTKSVIFGLALAAGAAGLGGCASGAGAVVSAQSASPDTFVGVGIDQAGAWTMAAFHDLDIAVTEDELGDHGLKREIEGITSSGEKVRVKIEPQSDGTTTFHVTASKSSMQADEALAQQVLAQILAKGGAQPK